MEDDPPPLRYGATGDQDDAGTSRPSRDGVGFGFTAWRGRRGPVDCGIMINHGILNPQNPFFVGPGAAYERAGDRGPRVFRFGR